MCSFHTLYSPFCGNCYRRACQRERQVPYGYERARFDLHRAYRFLKGATESVSPLKLLCFFTIVVAVPNRHCGTAPKHSATPMNLIFAATDINSVQTTQPCSSTFWISNETYVLHFTRDLHF